jgi:hypothetical protein
VKPSELIALLQTFYLEKLELKRRHEAGARFVRDYAWNNTYQYIVAREDVHLSWLRAALDALGAAAPEPGPAEQPSWTGEPGRRQREIIEDDTRRMQAFVDGWRARVERVTNARHRGMLRVVLGEALEHKRFFEQALAGRADLLGRHADGAGTTGEVLPQRWLE